jgi:hypothetical protein
MEVGLGPNEGCSVKEKKKSIYGAEYALPILNVITVLYKYTRTYIHGLLKIPGIVGNHG